MIDPFSQKTLDDYANKKYYLIIYVCIIKCPQGD